MRLRTIFISDVHLGTPGCQAGMLLDFLERYEADTVYLIGDILDCWRLRRGWYWPTEHNEVVQSILAKAHSGCRVVYVPGNHDDALRSYLGTHFGGIEVQKTAAHETADGRRFLVTHGDQFDAIVVHAKWLAHVGDRAYELALWLNTWINRLRRIWGGQYWSLSNWAKAQVKQAVSFISEYERVLTAEARRGAYDGVICGHIHSAAMHRIGSLEYVNTGDWVESCTAVVEHPDGRLELIDWAQEMNRRNAAQAPVRRRTRRRDKRKEPA